MPVDCYAAATVTAARRNDDPSAPFPFCDDGGCEGKPAGAPCNDGDACTVSEQCDGNGFCLPTVALTCAGPCLTGACDPRAGCVPQPAETVCNDGDACTAGDHCDGSSGACLPGAPRVCDGACLTGACDPRRGCGVRAATTSCDDGDPCTTRDHCDGSTDACIGGDAATCDDGNSCTADACEPGIGCTAVALPDGTACRTADRCHGPAACRGGSCDPGPDIECRDGDFCTDDGCDASTGCIFRPVSGARRSTCRIDELRALLSGAPSSAPGVSRRLGRQVDRAANILGRVNFDGPPKHVRRALKKVRGVLHAFKALVNRERRKLGAVLEGNLKRSADRAIANATLPPKS